MRLPWRQVSVPAVLSGRLAADEMITAMAETDDGRTLVATRRGLWTIEGDRAERLGWERIAKARLELGVLTVIPLHDVDVDADMTDLSVVCDGAAATYRLTRPAKVTDQVHTRVRRSVAASRYLPWPGAGGWVALRRVPGQDGLAAQVRLDPTADPSAPGFLPAVRQVVADLRVAPTSGTTGAD